jgi:predicted ATPase
MNLSRFQVIGLHGLRTMDVRLEDNKLVLVGENGTGKSTFVNLIYYFLTKQWVRLNEYRFSRIQARVGDHDLVITPENLEQHFALTRSILPFIQVSRHAVRENPMVIQDLFSQIVESRFGDVGENTETLIERFSNEFRMPPRTVQNLLNQYMKETKGRPTHVQQVEKQLSDTSFGQFLYLPTYRRIEQDLRSIFRGADIEAELKKFRDRLGKRSGSPFIELVEFGMEDVEQTIVARMSQIKESVRKGLDNLTGTYLRDVIRGIHTTVDVSQTEKIDAKSLDAVFARIDEATLPATDKSILKDKVAAISASHAIEERDKVIAHFLLKLIELYSEQQESERNVRDFVQLCNQYLAGKEMVYDNAKYTIYIQQVRSSGTPAGLESNLPMRTLSSGEKQIVSLFSHLYLSGQGRFFVIIDEPELSLSVPWQRRFLPDILTTGMCSGLVAVTHSPFVWENDLEKYVRPLAEFSVPFNDEGNRGAKDRGIQK